MSTPVINSVAVPQDILEQGDFRYIEQPMSLNGAGVAQAKGTKSAVWSFRVLTAAQYSWWVNTILGNAASLTSTMSLWVNDDRTAVTAFSAGTLYAPDMSEPQYRFGRYWELRFEFDGLVLA